MYPMESHPIPSGNAALGALCKICSQGFLPAGTARAARGRWQQQPTTRTALWALPTTHALEVRPASTVCSPLPFLVPPQGHDGVSGLLGWVEGYHSPTYCREYGTNVAQCGSSPIWANPSMGRRELWGGLVGGWGSPAPCR